MRTAQMPNVATRCQHWWGSPQVNKFEHVPDLGHKILLAGGLGPGLGPMGRDPCTARSNTSWVMVTWGPVLLLLWTDRHDWKQYLITTSLAGVKSDEQIEFHQRALRYCTVTYLNETSSILLFVFEFPEHELGTVFWKHSPRGALPFNENFLDKSSAT